MSPMWLLIVTLCLFVPTFGTPIQGGQDVGTVAKAGKSVIVSGQRLYPYIVYITINFKQNKNKRKANCGGVIIGPKTVLTAGHCLHDRPNPKITVHAGIVDTKWEERSGQKLIVEDYLKHERYEHICNMGEGRYCFGKNDIAILWTKDYFQFGPTVKEAILNRRQEKLVGKRGWILGWGLNNEGEHPTMLQKALVEVAPKQECEQINPTVFVSNWVICLAPVSKGTRAHRGDSGGPFVSKGVVYGLASITIHKDTCLSTTMDLFTCVANYFSWINSNLSYGPPMKRIQPRSASRNG